MSDESPFRAVAHPARRRVLDLLRQKERSVADLFATFNMSRPTFSQHLRILRTAGLIRQQRHGRSRVYALNHARLRPIASWIGEYGLS